MNDVIELTRKDFKDLQKGETFHVQREDGKMYIREVIDIKKEEGVTISFIEYPEKAESLSLMEKIKRLFIKR